MYKDIDEAIKHAREVADCCKSEISTFPNPEPYERYCNGELEKCAEEHEQLADWLEELKAIKDEKQYWDMQNNKAYEQGRADAINPIQKFIDDYDGAIIVSENMGVINGQQLINELKEIVEQIKEKNNEQN